MHYYKRNIGDYAKKAGRLSMLEHGAYTLLIDSCYDRERFPTRSEALEWCWARTEAEVAAVDFVLSRFFVLEGDVYTQKRIAEELSTYQQSVERNSRIATEREKKRRERARLVNESSPPEHESPPNHKPLTINQEPLTNKKDKNIKHLSASADVIEVFDHWRSRMNHERANLDAKRSKLIKSAMKIGYSKADLIEAIDGCAKSPFHMGQNQDGKVYDGLDLILRDASKIDGFIKTNRMPSLPAIGGGNATNRPYQDRPDNSAAGRVRANIARERAEEAAAEAAEGKDSGFVADDVIDVWPQMGDVIRF